MDKFCVGYQRVSTEEQVSNYSLANQTDYIKKTAQDQGYQLLKIFSDGGYSAKNTNRPGLQQMLSYCKENRGKVFACLIYKIDRLSRDTKDYLIMRSYLKKYGIKVISCTEPINDDATGEFTETLFAAVARFDNAIKSQRTLDGMKKRLESGWCLGKPPLGYRNSQSDNEKITIKDDCYHLVKKAWLEMEKGIYSSEDIAQMLNKWGVKTYQGKITYKQALRMFRDKYYMGLIATKRWGEFKGKHEPMIDEETFYRVQNILDGKRSPVISYKRNNVDFPLRRFYKCSICENWFTGAWSKGRSKRYPYYFCPNHRNFSFKRRLAHQKFIRLLNRLKPKPTYIELFCEVLKEKYQAKVKEATELYRRVEFDINHIKTKRQQLITKNLSGVYSDELFQEQMGIINREIDDKKRLLDQSRFKITNIDVLTDFMSKFLDNLDTYWASGSLQQRRLIQGSIFPNGIVYDNLKFRTVELSYPFKLICASDTPLRTSGVANGNRTRISCSTGKRPNRWAIATMTGIF